jgi:hypothetical protein
MVSLLQANEIPYFVHGANLAAMLPGLHIGSYNTPTIMVPEQAAQQAAELLSVFSVQIEPMASAPQPVGFWPKVRVVLEAVLFGWPVSQPPASKDQNDEA